MMMKVNNGRLKWIGGLVAFAVVIATAAAAHTMVRAEVGQNSAAVEELKEQNGDTSRWMREVDRKLGRIEGLLERR